MVITRLTSCKSCKKCTILIEWHGDEQSLEKVCESIKCQYCEEITNEYGAVEKALDR